MDERMTALDSGADDFLLKPISSHELLIRIEQFSGPYSHLRGRRRGSNGWNSISLSGNNADLRW